jgi:hypothetical protein
VTAWAFAGLSLVMAIGVVPVWTGHQGTHGLVHQVKIIGQNDDRADLLFNGRTLGLSVEESQHIRAATGYISCPGTKPGDLATGSASLIISSGQIVTAAHVFIGEHGRHYGPLSACYFENRADPMVRIPLLGTKGSYILGSDHPHTDGEHDFAVARLSQPLEGVVPFPVDVSSRPVTLCPPGGGEADGCGVLMISAMEDGITIGRSATSGISWNHAIARICAFRISLPALRGGSELYLGDCDSSPGGSGGANFVRDDGGLVLKAITGGVANSPGDYLPFRYDPHDLRHNNFSYSIGVEGALLRDANQLDEKFNPK